MRHLEISSFEYLALFPNYVNTLNLLAFHCLTFLKLQNVLSLFLLFSAVIYFFEIKMLISQDKLQKMVWGIKTNLVFFSGNKLFNKQCHLGTFKICPLFLGYWGGWNQPTGLSALFLGKVFRNTNSPCIQLLSFAWGNVGLQRLRDFFTSVHFLLGISFSVAPEHTEHIQDCMALCIWLLWQFSTEITLTL